MKNFKKSKGSSKTWGVLGKMETFYSPEHFLGEKVPLNNNPTDAWDYKKSNYRRIDLVPIQQGGVVPQTTPSPDITPSPTPTNTTTPTNTPTSTSVTPTPSPTNNAACPEELSVSGSTYDELFDGTYTRQYEFSGTSFVYGYTDQATNKFTLGTAPNGKNYPIYMNYDGSEYSLIYFQFWDPGTNDGDFYAKKQVVNPMISGFTNPFPAGSLLAGGLTTIGSVVYPKQGNYINNYVITYPAVCPTPTPTSTTTSTPTQTPTNTPTSTTTSTPTQTPTNTPTPSSSPVPTVVTFTSSTTWTAPANLTITVECWGGGGAGGPSGNLPITATGGGGAGGAYAKKQLNVISGTTYTINVGAGGASSTGFGGNAGSPSWFSATTVVYAQGGAGGSSPNTGGQNGAGAIGSSSSSIGDIVRAGGNGGTGNITGSGGGGGGAGSSTNGFNANVSTGGSGGTGNPSTGNGANGVTVISAGNNGSVYGGGGSGAKSVNTGARASGAGAAGLVRITY